MEVTEGMIEAGWDASMEFDVDDLSYLPTLRREMVVAIFQAMMRASPGFQEVRQQ
ncbi:hypothetical protein LMG6000_02227 [Achromobacter insolitus]|uniref:Uncharacterized protein n=1 Tax=Achromobacter insolitus TaxID=217204 RepID=A0A6S7F8U7_9BURK|nr:hypothetical protein LMG6000_02227 [Achromobacter insolitus]CAB3939455.1 hypothetical protein LMG5997_04044 [Achromobacter insolitus]